MSSSSIFLCVNCSQQYNNNNKKPRTFPCGHVFCEECIKKFENSKIFKCPLDKIFHFNLTIDKIPICVQILDNLPNLENINTNINNKNNDTNDNNNNDISDYINSIGNKISFIKNQINLYNKSEQDILTYFNKQFNKITIFFEKIFIEIKNKKNFFNERISEKLKEQKQKIDKNKKILTNYVIKLNDIIKSYEKIQKSNNFSTFKNMKKNSEKEINDIIKDINNNFITYSQKQIYPFFNEPNMFDIQNRNFFGEIKYTNNLYLNCGNENINNNLNNEFNEINDKNIINFNEEEENIFNKNLFNEKIKKDLDTPDKNDSNNNNNNNKYFCPSAKQTIRKIEHYNNINNKSNNIINNNNNSLIKESLPHSSHTLNNFYNCHKVNDNLELENTKLNKDISLKEIKLIEEDKNSFLRDLFISKNKEINNETKNECDKNQENNNEDEIIRDSEFFNLKKDYDLFYSSKFINSIKNDLIDLEFNLALDKSISLFILYNKEANIFNKNNKELIYIIKNYINKSEEINKKINILNNKKRKNETNKNMKLIIKDSIFDFNNVLINQKKIFENIINEKKNNKKEELRIIINSIMKTRPSLLDIINNKEDKKGIEEDKLKLCNQSSKNLCKSQKVDNIQKNESKDNINENKNKKILNKNNKGKIDNNKKLFYKKHKSAKNKFNVKTNKNLQKNNSINNLLSFEKINARNNLNIDENYKECKSGNINNIRLLHRINENGKNNNNNIFYSTARTKFYNLNSGKFK